MAGYVGMSDEEAIRINELLSTIESDIEDNGKDTTDYTSDDDVSDDPGISPEVSRFFGNESYESEDEIPLSRLLSAKSSAINTRAENEMKRKLKQPINIPKFEWVEGGLTPDIAEFDNTDSGFTINESHSSIIGCFECLFTEKLAKIVATETNRYFQFVVENSTIPRCSRLQKWQDTNENEIYLFLAVTMLISRNNKLKLTDCWSKDPLLYSDIFHKVISRDRYLNILRLLHFSDNNEQPPGNRLYKIESIISEVRNIIKDNFIPFEKLCIDESLILFKGRLSFKQYIKSKRHRFGVKLFILADVETNYVLDLIVYTGSTTQYENIQQLGISGSIVTTMMKPYFGKNHCLYTDNWYTSPCLADFLLKNKTNLCGTVRANRLGMPTFPELKQKGETSSMHNNKMMVTKWLDRKTVHMLTTFHEDKLVPTGKINHTTKEQLEKPLCVKEYNENMGTIDKIDMILSSVECLRKSTKWYKKVFFHLIDLLLVNAHAMYKAKTGEHISLADFQLELTRQLIDKYLKEERNVKIGRPTSKTAPTRLLARHFPELVPAVPGGKKTHNVCVLYVNTQKLV